MALVKFTCTRCGDVSVPSKMTCVAVYSDTEVRAARFRCPLCGVGIERQITTAQHETLASIGCITVLCDTDTELSDPARSEGPVDASQVEAEAAALRAMRDPGDFLDACSRRLSG